MSGENELLLEALKRTAGVLKQSGIPFALAGTYAIYARGGPASEHDVDFALLAEHGFRPERPCEDWLVKVYFNDRLVDLLFYVGGRPVTREMLDRAEDLEVGSVAVPVMDATDVIVGMLLAFSHHHCDFAAVLPQVRALREQIDWRRVRDETAQSPFAYAFLVLAERLELIPPEREAPHARAGT